MRVPTCIPLGDLSPFALKETGVWIRCLRLTQSYSANNSNTRRFPLPPTGKEDAPHSIGLVLGKPALVYLTSVYSTFVVCQSLLLVLCPRSKYLRPAGLWSKENALVSILSHQDIECQIARSRDLTWILI